MPYHWGPNGLTTGDATNELSAMILDPNVHIQEVKASPSTSNRVAGHAAPRCPFLEAYRAPGGITEHTGMRRWPRDGR